VPAAASAARRARRVLAAPLPPAAGPPCGRPARARPPDPSLPRSLHHPQLCDFGLARVIAAAAAAGGDGGGGGGGGDGDRPAVEMGGGGTLTHLAPELLRGGEPATTAIDAYSFGGAAARPGPGLGKRRGQRPSGVRSCVARSPAQRSAGCHSGRRARGAALPPRCRPPGVMLWEVLTGLKPLYKGAAAGGPAGSCGPGANPLAARAGLPDKGARRPDKGARRPPARRPPPWLARPPPGLSWEEVADLVAGGGARPEFPPGAPPAYASLARDCWAADPAARPRLGAVKARLHAIASAPPGACPAGGEGGGGAAGGDAS
jgi:serine/threonine protein kinase